MSNTKEQSSIHTVCIYTYTHSTIYENFSYALIDFGYSKVLFSLMSYAYDVLDVHALVAQQLAEFRPWPLHLVRDLL
eukprot:SAG31_NODE_4708_length_3019_cov_1.313699_2_plen_77_part_00